MRPSPEWQAKAKHKAKEILKEYAETRELKIPIPIQEVIESYFPDVNYIVSEDDVFPEGVSAFASRDITIDWLIVVNANECVERQRFSSAHELGHMSLITNTAKEVHCSTDKGSWEEKLCDMFAGHILMPEEFVLSYYETHPSPYVEDIARYFKVSTQVAKIELESLGLPIQSKYTVEF